MREHEWVLTLTVCTQQLLFLLKESAEVELLAIPRWNDHIGITDERDDCWVRGMITR